MRLIKTTMRNGKAVHTVEMEAGEKLIAIKPESFYELGHPLNDVVPGHIIEESVRVIWCPIEQKWETQ